MATPGGRERGAGAADVGAAGRRVGGGRDGGHPSPGDPDLAAEPDGGGTPPARAGLDGRSDADPDPVSGSRDLRSAPDADAASDATPDAPADRETDRDAYADPFVHPDPDPDAHRDADARSDADTHSQRASRHRVTSRDAQPAVCREAAPPRAHRAPLAGNGHSGRRRLHQSAAATWSAT